MNNNWPYIGPICVLQPIYIGGACTPYTPTAPILPSLLSTFTYPINRGA